MYIYIYTYQNDKYFVLTLVNFQKKKSQVASGQKNKSVKV